MGFVAGVLVMVVILGAFYLFARREIDQAEKLRGSSYKALVEADRRALRKAAEDKAAGKPIQYIDDDDPFYGGPGSQHT